MHIDICGEMQMSYSVETMIIHVGIKIFHKDKKTKIQNFGHVQKYHVYHITLSSNSWVPAQFSS